MKTYIFNYLKSGFILAIVTFAVPVLCGQNKSNQENDSVSTDTTKTKLNMDATYDRPFLNKKNGTTSSSHMPSFGIGGYLEANTIHTIEDGISEGLSFQARRLTVFMSSSIAKRISFLSEVEIEEGGQSILIEFAAVDVTLHPMFNLRGGVIMNPIGAFNQNHDGPKWEFVERPDVGVNLLPATWSNAGFGIFGKLYQKDWVFGYEAYLTNGFDENIIDNETHKTYLPASKSSIERFEENFSGYPLTTVKMAIKNRKWGELGLSYMGGRYNRLWEDGLQLAPSHQSLNAFAVDYNIQLPGIKTVIMGEAVKILIDIPETYTQQYGNKQHGFFVDIVQPLWRKPVFGWKNAHFNIAARLDYVDWNVGRFKETSTNIGEHQWAMTPAISFRPSGQTVLRLNYRYQWTTDILNNPAVPSASWLFGFSTYF